MKKIITGVIIIVLVLAAGFMLNYIDEPEETEDVEEIAKEWIKENASTYIERGGRDLEYLDSREFDGKTELTFEFEATEAGYGTPGEDEAAAQVLTPHVIAIEVEGGEVVSAITDGVFDEITEEKIEDPEERQDLKDEETAEEFVSHQIYFYIVEDGMERLITVEREFPTSQEMGEKVLEELLAGPNTEEREIGISTAIDEEVELLDFYIEDGIAYADFNEQLDAAGSAMVTLIRDQIERTILELENVEGVNISIEGETEDILQP